MGRNVKRRRRLNDRKNKTVRKYILLLMTAFLVITGGVIWCLKGKIEPNLEEAGRMRAKVMVSQIVNKAVNNELYQTGEMQELLIREKDDNGKMEMLQANTQAMNLLMTEISKELQKEFADRKEDVYPIRAGALLGDRILSQAGPYVNLRIVPLSVTSMDFETDFESAGINQTRYRVYIHLVCEVKVLAPFSAETLDVDTDVLVAEAVILGGVPDSYVNVPEEDILDVTNE